MSRAAALALGLAALAWSACAPADRADSGTTAPPEAEATSVEALEARSMAFLAAIRERDVEAAAAVIHPARGVRFSPYAFVDVAGDQVLSRGEFVEAWHEETPRLWGFQDGTGDPLRMSCADYLQRFVYDVDFMAAEQVSIGETIGRGNTTNNAAQAYPQATLVEFHLPGSDPRFDGLDWKSLRLAFEPLDGEWFLVGVIHDEWTI